VALENSNPYAHHVLGLAYYCSGEIDGAKSEFETSLRLNPSFAMAHHLLGRTLTSAGKPDEAIPCIQTAIRLSPLDVRLGQSIAGLAEAYLCLREYEKAIEFASRAFRLRNINLPGLVYLISALGHLGRPDDARDALDELIVFQPNISIAYVRDSFQRRLPAYVDHILEGLREGGLPE
jgi:tetratricopeptide (TPR) repeat protein